MALVDLAGPGASLDGHGRARAVEGHPLGGEGQGPVVLEEHHPLAGGLVGHGEVVLLPLVHSVGIAGLGQ